MRSIIIKTTFVVSFLLIIMGAIFKIMHAPFGDVLLSLGIISFVISILVALYEIFAAPHIKFLEKMIWLVGFITTGWLVMLIYLLVRRKDVVHSAGNRLG